MRNRYTAKGVKKVKIKFKNGKTHTLNLEKLQKFSLNPVDMAILGICYNTEHTQASLRRDLNINTNSLVPHLEKLSKFKLLKVKSFGQGKSKRITTNPDAKEIIGFITHIDKVARKV